MLICAACGKSLPNVVGTTVIKYPGCNDCSIVDIKRALEALLGVKMEDKEDNHEGIGQGYSQHEGEGNEQRI